jgi:hypothetical protein
VFRSQYTSSVAADQMRRKLTCISIISRSVREADLGIRKLESVVS